VPDGSPTGRPPDRYEPLPGLAELPGWIWRKTGPRLRIAVAVTVLAIASLAVALVPEIRESRQQRAAFEQRDRAEQRARRLRELEAEQRPRSHRSDSTAPAGASPRVRLAARAGLLDELSTTIVADARRRVRDGALTGPILRAECEPFPRSVATRDAAEDLSLRRGRYACIAVTSEFERTEESIGGALGHPYRALVDFETGRYGYCKISGRTDPTHNQQVTTPRACGG
jgi:hypothetical protein